jgi:hypothetical protein
MATLGFKLLRALLAVLLFGIVNFLTAGLGACLCHFIECHGKPPEMLGWVLYFLLMGSVSLVLGTGGLLALSVYFFRLDIERRWSSLFSAVQGIFLGILFLLVAFIIDSMPIDVLPDWLVLFILVLEWLFFTGISIFSCILLNRKYSEKHSMKKKSV